jgi:hypothetical protein
MGDDEMAAKHTPGPWKWFGNAGSNRVYLATTHSGRRYVMDFVRWGMRGAQPRFQPREERGGMIDAKDLLQFEVGDQSIVGVDQAKKDGSVYRYDVRGINCADARLIESAWVIPDLLDALSQCEDYFDNRADADCDQDGYIPNEEMKLLGVVRDALKKAGV